MKTGTVSVVMPTYNHARYVRAAIASVLAQTHRELELVVVDNHSTDGTAECVHGFHDARVRYFTFRNNGVIAASRNFGARQARGEFIAFLDSDDAWAPEKLERQVAAFPDERVALVASGAWIVEEDRVGRREFVGVSRRGFKEYSYTEVLKRSPVITSAVVVRRSAFVEAGGFDESPDFVCVEDYDLWLRIARLGVVRVIGAPLIYYRVHADPSRDRVTETERGLGVLEKHVRLGYLADAAVLNNARGAIYLGMARLALEIDVRASRDYHRKAFRLSGELAAKCKAALGYASTFLPASRRRAVVGVLARGRGWAYEGLERVWARARRRTTVARDSDSASSSIGSATG